MSTAASAQRIWLTGATSGIGRALALRLLDQGHRVALSARSHDDLVKLAKGRGNAFLLPLDVSDPQAVRDAGQKLETALAGSTSLFSTPAPANT